MPRSGKAFLVLGVVVGSLTIPFVLDGHRTVLLWALEGAALVWVGVSWNRLFVRLSGILLQLAAAFIFLDSVWYPFVAVPFANYYFLGCLFLAAAALFSSYCLDTLSCTLHSWEHYLPFPLLLVGLIWWYLGGLREVALQMRHIGTEKAFLLFCSAGTIFFGMAATKIPWQRLGLTMYLQLPVMVGLALLSYVSFPPGSHFLMDWGAVIWPLAFIVQFRILSLFGGDWPRRARKVWHSGTICLLLVMVCQEASWALRQTVDLG